MEYLDFISLFAIYLPFCYTTSEVAMSKENKKLSEKDKLFKTIRYLIYFVIVFFIFTIILAIVPMIIV